MSLGEDCNHFSDSAWASDKNWVANARATARKVDSSDPSVAVTGETLSLKRCAAITARPMQDPDARDWLTICAQVAASAVRVHGSAIPSMHMLASLPNIANMSTVSN